MTTQVYVNSVTLTDAPEFNAFDSLAYMYLTTVVGTNTITATGPANMTLAAPQRPLVLVPQNTNTGATTLNITPSGGAALTAKNVFANGVACVGGELKIAVPVMVVYDGTQYNIIGSLSGGQLETSYTGTLTGGTTAPTGTVFATKIGNTVTLRTFDWTLTSNSVSKTITGMPAALRPAATQSFFMSVQDNGGSYMIGLCNVASSGVITMTTAPAGSAWTNSGTASGFGISFSYQLN